MPKIDRSNSSSGFKKNAHIIEKDIIDLDKSKGRFHTEFKIDWSQYIPKLFQYLPQYNLSMAFADLGSALIIASTSLPLTMGYAISAGLRPEVGLYCSVVSGFIGAVLTGSRFQITNPTAGFHLFVAALLSNYGPNGLFTGVIMAGLILVGLGLSGLGKIVHFIPRPIVLGITNGIGLNLIINEIIPSLGLQIPGKVPGHLPGKLTAIFSYIDTISYPTLFLALSCTLAMFVLKKPLKKLPLGVLVALSASLLAYFLELPVRTIGQKYEGGIPLGLPTLFNAHFDFALIAPTLGTSISIAMLVILKSLVAAVVGDKLGKDTHNPNMELVSQGMANIGAAFFGGMPATGSIGRTANNVTSGGKSPMAGVFQSLVILTILLFAAPLANNIPLCVLAGIMIYIGYSIGAWKDIPKILKTNKSDIMVWLTTISLAVFSGLDTALGAGVLVAAALYIQKASSTTSITVDTGNHLADSLPHILHTKEIPKGTSIFSIHGPMLFGTADIIENLPKKINHKHPVIIIRLRHMTAIDSTGLLALEDFLDELKTVNKHLILCSARTEPYKLFKKTGFIKKIGKNNFTHSVEEALDRAKEILSEYDDKELSKTYIGGEIIV